MPLYSPSNSPQENLRVLGENPYPGRLLVQGWAGDIAVQAYLLGGRSEDSQNRILVLEDNIVSTETWDKSKPPKHPALTIYDAMRRARGRHFVSNGDHTATGIQYFRSGKTFTQAMETRKHEPDPPNNTPRIAGYIDLEAIRGEPGFAIAVIRSMGIASASLYNFYSDRLPEIELKSGVGYAVHTYKGNADPLPSFDEAPFALPLESSAEAMAKLLWESVNPKTRVAVAAKTIPKAGEPEFHIINLHDDEPPSQNS